MQTVPGHNVGENMKEQLAVTKQPRARPALLSPRRVAGCEKRMEAAMVPMANVPMITVLTVIVGQAERMVADTMLTATIAAPANNVRFTSPAEHVSGDAAESLKLPDKVRDETADVFEGDAELADPAMTGSGGCSTSIETARARYPRITSPMDVLIVKPNSSHMKLAIMTTLVATFEDQTCFNSEKLKPVFQSVQVRFAATAIVRIRPVRMPPRSIYA